MTGETAPQNSAPDRNEEEQSGSGIVYVLTNPAMPGIVKIGMTQSNLGSRLSQLYSTGVPVPFECAKAVTVADAVGVERALHQAFERLNPNREFFEVEPERVIPLLDMMKIEDVTPDSIQTDTEDLDSSDVSARDRLKNRRRRSMRFDELDIPIGAELRFRRNNEVATVANNSTRVKHNGQEYAISRITAVLSDGSSDYISPLNYWTYEGRLLREISDEVHGWID